MLKESDLLEIKGGGINMTVLAAGIAGVISFLVGVFDGFARPFRCR